MISGGTHAAARVASLLAALSAVMTVGTGVTAGVVMARDDNSGGSGTLVRGSGDSTDPPPTPDDTQSLDYDYTGWETLDGLPGESGSAASYQVPRQSWRTFDPDYAVAFRDKAGKKTAKGHAPANYYGNHCSEAGKKVAGGWTVLADTEPSGDLTDEAEAAVRRWARGYAADDAGNLAKLSEPTTEEITLPDGTRAARSKISVDMSGLSGACLSDSAEIMATTIDTSDGTKSLVQARYLTQPGVSDEVWQQISDSLAE